MLKISNKIDKSKSDLVHVAKHWALKNLPHFSDDDYRKMLFDVGCVSETSKDLTNQQFKDLMDIFSSLGFESTARKARKNINTISKKRGFYKPATDQQIAMLRRLWQNNEFVISKTDEALLKFIYRIVKKISFNILIHRDVEKISEAIKKIKGKKHVGI